MMMMVVVVIVAARRDDNSPLTPVTVVMVMMVILRKLHFPIRLGCHAINCFQSGHCIRNGLQKFREGPHLQYLGRI